MISGILRPDTSWKSSRTWANMIQPAAQATTVVPETAAKAMNSLALMPNWCRDLCGEACVDVLSEATAFPPKLTAYPPG